MVSAHPTTCKMHQTKVSETEELLWPNLAFRILAKFPPTSPPFPPPPAVVVVAAAAAVNCCPVVAMPMKGQPSS